MSQPPPTLSARVAEEVRALMGRRRMSGRALANAAGIPKSTANRWVSGDTAMSLDDVERVARALGVTVVELLPVEERAIVAAPLAHAAGAEGLAITGAAPVTEIGGPPRATSDSGPTSSGYDRRVTRRTRRTRTTVRTGNLRITNPAPHFVHVHPVHA
jgi:transcriptional regulator with XRE-family HTH domain